MKTAAATLKGFEVMRMIRRGHCLTCRPRVEDEVRIRKRGSTSITQFGTTIRSCGLSVVHLEAGFWNGYLSEATDAKRCAGGLVDVKLRFSTTSPST